MSWSSFKMLLQQQNCIGNSEFWKILWFHLGTIKWAVHPLGPVHTWACTSSTQSCSANLYSCPLLHWAMCGNYRFKNWSVDWSVDQLKHKAHQVFWSTCESNACAHLWLHFFSLVPGDISGFWPIHGKLAFCWLKILRAVKFQCRDNVSQSLWSHISMQSRTTHLMSTAGNCNTSGERNRVNHSE